MFIWCCFAAFDPVLCKEIVDISGDEEGRSLDQSREYIWVCSRSGSKPDFQIQGRDAGSGSPQGTLQRHFLPFKQRCSSRAISCCECCSILLRQSDSDANQSSSEFNHVICRQAQNHTLPVALAPIRTSRLRTVQGLILWREMLNLNMYLI